MSEDELWSLHERVTSVLARKILAEKGRLEQRLRQLGQDVLTSDEHGRRVRRPYPAGRSMPVLQALSPDRGVVPRRSIFNIHRVSA
jgi:hypothetical protein